MSDKRANYIGLQFMLRPAIIGNLPASCDNCGAEIAYWKYGDLEGEILDTVILYLEGEDATSSNHTTDLCPECAVSRSCLSEMLKDEEGSDNLIIAIRIIESCETCKAYFKEVDNETG